MSFHHARITILGIISKLVVIGFLLAPSVLYADDAVVLPKGYWRLMADSQFFLPWDKKFNKSGNAEPLGAEFNANLNSAVFSSLAVFGPGATLGRSVVSLERSGTIVVFQPAYGLTDRLTVGMNIPYFRAKTTVKAGLDTSTATVGKNPAFVTPTNPLGLAPLVVPGTTPLNIDDVQKLLESQGFKRIKDHLEEGLGDIEVGGRYQYYRGENFRAAFTGGVRFPTGFDDDPNNFVDFGVGNGAYALLFQLQHDYMRQAEGLGKRLGFPDPGDFFVNTTIRYKLNLPDKKAIRVCDINLPTCSAFDDSARRILGNRVELEGSARIGLWHQGLIFSPLYFFRHKFQDHWSGDKGFDYGILAKDSESTAHQYILTLTYTTIPLFLQKRFPYPLSANVSYRDQFAGTNRAPNNRYIGFNFQFFF